MWKKHIEEFSKQYYVIAALLDGMDYSTSAEFISVEDSSQKIFNYAPYLASKKNG